MLIAVLTVAPGAPAGATDADEAVSSSLTFIHGVPGQRFDVYVGKELVAANAEFSSLHPGIALSQGRHKVAIREPGARAKSRPIAKLRVKVTNSAPQTVVAHLDNNGEIDLYKRRVNTKWVNGEARLIVRHLAHAPAIQLRYDGGLKHRSVASGQTRKSVVPALPFELGVYAQTSEELQPILDPVMVSLAANTVTVVYVIGSNDDGTLTTLSHAYRTPR